MKNVFFGVVVPGPGHGGTGPFRAVAGWIEEGHKLGELVYLAYFRLEIACLSRVRATQDAGHSRQVVARAGREREPKTPISGPRRPFPFRRRSFGLPERGVFGALAFSLPPASRKAPLSVPLGGCGEGGGILGKVGTAKI